MSDQTTSDVSKTIETPVSTEELTLLTNMHRVRSQCAERLLDLEQERVRVLRQAAQVDTDRQKLFEKILIDRKLPPGLPVEVNSETGVITPMDGAMEQFLQMQAASTVPAVQTEERKEA